MITVHHLSDSRSQRILWLLEELEIPYEIKHYERTAEQKAPKELFKISPLGKAPVIQDGDVMLAESGAIVDYLIARYGNSMFQIQPSSPAYLHNLYFSHYAEGSLMPLMTQKFIYDLVPKRAPVLMRPLVSAIFANITNVLLMPEFGKHLVMIENHLSSMKTGWFAGGNGPTAADFQMAFPLEGIVSVAPHMATPKMVEYVKRVHDRPAYKRALERGESRPFSTMSEKDVWSFLNVYYCGRLQLGYV